jgi:hypothetical protein
MPTTAHTAVRPALVLVDMFRRLVIVVFVMVVVIVVVPALPGRP